MPRAAILIDGGYLLKRLPRVRPDVNVMEAMGVVQAIERLVHSHLRQLNQIHQAANLWSLLYRCFYYDAVPYANRLHRPVSGAAVDYAKSDIAYFRSRLFAAIRKQPNFALRLGEVRKPSDRSWVLKPEAQKLLLNGGKGVDDLKDADFTPDLRQKGVDMRIGLDIAAITLKKQADTIILVSGDSDFVPAAKLARREGVTFILDPLWRGVSPDLLEHIDRLASGFYNPNSKDKPDSDG